MKMTKSRITDYSRVTRETVLEVGKVAYGPYMTKSCPVTVRFGWRYRQSNGESYFSVSGLVYNAHRTDAYLGGQCVEEIAAMFPDDELVQEILSLWREYHLSTWKRVPASARLRIQGVIERINERNSAPAKKTKEAN